MQIHEITYGAVTEGILKTIGQDIKNVVTSPIEKFKALEKTPGAFTSGTKAGAALNSVEQQKADATIAQQTQQRAKQLAQQWVQMVRSKSQVQEQTQSGQPTPAELQQYQQRLAAASAPPKTGFAGLPGSKPTTGGQVAPGVTAKPKTVMTGNRAKEFKTWVDQQLTGKATGTSQTISMNQVRQDPATLQQLNALLPAIIMKNDPAAVEQYLTIAMTAMQRLATQARQTQQARVASGQTVTQVSPLSTILNPKAIEDIKTMAQDPVKAAAIKQALGLR